MLHGAVAKPEVARVLVQDRGEDAIADDGAVKSVEKSCSGALSKALNAPAESSVVVQGLVIAGNENGDSKGDRIGGRTEGELHFLAGRQRNGISAIGDIEGGHDSQRALLLLLLDLFLSLLLLRLRTGLLRVGLRAGTTLRGGSLCRGRLRTRRGLLILRNLCFRRKLRLRRFGQGGGSGHLDGGNSLLRKKLKRQRQ